MDNGDADVKIAAAQAWARSTRPLGGLVKTNNDPIIQPILILAAQKRGQSEETMLALIGIKPTQDQSAQAWQNALVEMARRVPPLAVLHADQALGVQKESPALRDAVLTAVISHLAPDLVLMTAATAPATQRAGSAAIPTPATSPATPHGVAPMVWDDLLLARAELHLNQMGDLLEAGSDLRRINPDGPGFNGQRRQRWLMDMFRVSLAGGDIDAALGFAKEFWTDAKDPGRGQVVAALLAAAKRDLAHDHAAMAVQILTPLRELMGATSTSPWNEKLSELERQGRQAPPWRPSMCPLQAAQ